MPRKIKLDGIKLHPNAEIEQSSIVNSNDRDDTTNDLITYSEILKATLQQFPNKMLFSITDASAALGVSPEFIRKGITNGFINSVNLGDRKMISINELAKIIYQGV